MNVSLAFRYPDWLLALCLFLVLAFSVWSYRKTIPAIGLPFRIVLTLFRSLVLMGILFLVFDPQATIRKEHKFPPRVAILIDQSASMLLKDKQLPRSDKLKTILKGQGIRALCSTYTCSFFGFSDTLRTCNPDSMDFSAQGTDIAKAFHSVAQTDAPFDAAFLLSDGRITEGGDPAGQAAVVGFPIYAVPLGEDKQYRDVLVTQTFHHDVAYKGDSLPVEAALSGPGYGGETVEVQLLSGQTVVATQQLRLPFDGMEAKVAFTYVPKAAGLHTLTVRVGNLDGELTHENNSTQFVIDVLESKIHVLLMANAPSPDVAFIKHNLERDENIHCTVCVLKNTNTFYQGPLAPDSLDLMDCCLLIDLPASSLGTMPQSMLESLIRVRHVPYLLIAGSPVQFSFYRQWDEAFPITSWRKVSNFEVEASQTAEGRMNAVTQQESGSAGYEMLPPLYSNWKGIAVHPRASVLLQGKTQTNLGKAEAVPLLIASGQTSSKSLVLLGHELYRWDLMMKGVGQQSDVLRNLLQQSIRWLAVRDLSKPFHIQPAKSIVNLGDAVRLNARLLDETLRPMENGRVDVRLVRNGREQIYPMVSRESGYYELSLSALAEGYYTVFGEAFKGEHSVYRDTTEFVVTSVPVEFFQTRSDPLKMAQIAKASGGCVVEPDSVDQFVQTLHLNPHTEETQIHLVPLQWRWTWVLLLALLTTEWFLRKRSGLL